MSWERLEAILWSLHLRNPQEDEENERKKNTPQYERLFTIKPLYTEMAHFQPYKNICIGERIMVSGTGKEYGHLHGSESELHLSNGPSVIPSAWPWLLLVCGRFLHEPSPLQICPPQILAAVG